MSDREERLRADAHAYAHAAKGADVGQGTNRPTAMNTGSRWQKLDTALVAVNRPIGSSSSPLPVDRTGPIDLGAVYSATGKHGSEAGRVP